MKKNMLSWMTIALMAFTCVGLAACGGDDDDGGIDNAPPPPDTRFVVSNGAATDFTRTEATISFTVANGSNYALSDVGIVYGTESNMNELAYSGRRVSASSQEVLNETTVQYTVHLTGLSPETTYYYYAYAGEHTASERTLFRTLSYAGCPDSNHPHKIDLGLPSGTLWSCCNVGAFAPHNDGFYFAWGETGSKVSYMVDTYRYKSGNGEQYFINLGDDIAGTRFDGATANWGAPWCMPNKEQCQELINNTSSVWTTMAGVYGRKIRGSSGYYIFVPAVGYYYGTDVHSSSATEKNEAYGYYWLSTAYEEYIGNAYNLDFYKSRISISKGLRSDGRPIRPVCK